MSMEVSKAAAFNNPTKEAGIIPPLEKQETPLQLTPSLEKDNSLLSTAFKVSLIQILANCGATSEKLHNLQNAELKQLEKKLQSYYEQSNKNKL